MKTMWRNGFGSSSGCVKSITEQAASRDKSSRHVAEELAMDRFLSKAPAISSSTDNFRAAARIPLAGSPSS